MDIGRGRSNKKMHLYTFDLRMKNRKELYEFLIVIKSVIAINKEIEVTGDNELYLELLKELSISLEKQIQCND